MISFLIIYLLKKPISMFHYKFFYNLYQEYVLGGSIH